MQHAGSVASRKGDAIPRNGIGRVKRMRSIWCVLLSFFCVVGMATAEDPVYFADPQLKTAVEGRLCITDPTPSDMLYLTQLESVPYWESDDSEKIHDLTGLEYATNLQTLNLRFNLLSNISPLAGLTRLEDLNLSENGISDLSPLAGLTRLTCLNVHENDISDISALSGLVNMTTLILHLNTITDLSPLSGLTNLRELDASANQLSDLTPLSTLTNLSTLCLWINEISDLSPLAGLANLETLDVRMNKICDLSPLAGLSRLQDLNLRTNLISDISPLCSLTSLSSLDLHGNPLNNEAFDIYIPLITTNNRGISIAYDHLITYRLTVSSSRGGSVITPGEGTYWRDEGVSVSLKARPDPGYLFAGWSGTYPSADNPLLITMNADCEMKATFVSALDSLYVDDDASCDAGPQDSTTSDPGENGTAEHPFDSIQEAIELAAEGASIIVRPGVYYENISFLNKDIRLMGIDVNDTTPESWPVIDGAGSGPVVRFSRGQSLRRQLTGFVITRGVGQIAGAIYCDGASPTIANCLIVGNRATDLNGAAVYCRDSQAVLTNCTVADNYAGRGAGLTLVNSNVTVLNSILWNDSQGEILPTGTSAPDIRYCDVRGGWVGTDNIDGDPLFARSGSWVDPDDPTQVLGADITWAAWTDGDYHVQSEAGRWDVTTQDWVQDDATSPCVDAGFADTPVANEPAPNGSRVNLGVYGGTTEASMSPDEPDEP